MSSSPFVPGDPPNDSEPADDLDHVFFRRGPSPAPEQDLWDLGTNRLPAAARRARSATLAMLMLSAVGFPSYLIYHRVLRPQPVALSRTGPALPSDAAFRLSDERTRMEELLAAATTPASLSKQSPVYASLGSAGHSARGGLPRSDASSTAGDAKPAGQARQALLAHAHSTRSAPEETSEPAPDQQASAPVAGASSSHQTPTSRKITLLLAKAYSLLNAGQYDAAVEVAHQATLDDPTVAEAWLVLGAAHDALGNRSSAQRAYRACSDQQGRHAVSCRLLIQE